MNLIKYLNLREDEILNSLNFIKNSDIIFSGILSRDDFNNIFNKQDFHILNEDKENICFMTKELRIFNGCIIFCHTNYVNQLFKILKKKQNIKNIRIITSQSDKKIGYYSYFKKPKNVELWFSTNTKIVKKDLIAIPLGISNTNNKKNIGYIDFYKSFIPKEKKINALYCNFNLLTNYFHRIKTKVLVENALTVKEGNFNQFSYINSLFKYKFILCPWGNGYDTHRFWETLYSCGVPVTKKNSFYESFNSFPMVLLSKYKTFKIENLQNQYIPNEKTYFEMMNINWWFNNIINKDKLANPEIKDSYLVSDNLLNKIIKQKVITDQLLGFTKKFFTLARKIHSKIFKININSFLS